MIDKLTLSNLFQSYNSEIQKECEKSLETVKKPSDYFDIINKARTSWESSRISDKLPAEYFSQLIEQEDLDAVFKKAAEVCDEFIPESLAKRIISTGSISLVEKYAFKDTGINKKITAIKLIGMAKDASYCERLINLFYIESLDGDLIKEKARDAIISIGKSAVFYIESTLSKIELLEDNDFHLIIALIGIDFESKSDVIYKILKESFKKTEEKALAARCLSDYGDGRAVPFLRGYLLRNIKKLDKNTVLEIQGSILNLGGSVEDIDIP